MDGCIAAAFVSWVAESPLTGPGGGGFMLVHRAKDGMDSLLDFFAAVPGAGLPPGARGEMLTVDISFDEHTSQVFHVGPAAVAVPGVPAGLATAHRRYATLPWSELLAPAIELARAGVALNSGQAFFHEILDAILRSEPEGRRIYGGDCRSGRGSASSWTTSRGRSSGWPPKEPRPSTAASSRDEWAAPCSSAAERSPRPTWPSTGSSAAARCGRVPRRRARLQSSPPSSGILIAFALRVLDRLGPMAPRGARGDRPRRRGDARSRAAAQPRLRRRAVPRGRFAPAPGGQARAGGGGVRAVGPSRRGARAGRAPSTTHKRRGRAWRRCLALRLDGLRVGLRRAGHGHTNEQHARRARPESSGQGLPAGARG